MYVFIAQKKEVWDPFPPKCVGGHRLDSDIFDRPWSTSLFFDYLTRVWVRGGFSWCSR